MRSSRVVPAAAVGAVVLLVGGGVLFALGDRVLGIVGVVLGLACVRVCTWWLKVRALTEVGLDLHRRDDAT